MYVKRILKKDFEQIHMIGDDNASGYPLLVLANHTSWWDGFWAMHLNNQVLKKEFYVLMLEDELAKRKFFSKVGAYSIHPGKASIKDSLVFTQKLLQKTENMVLFFPEGTFSPASQHLKKFNKGLSFLYRDAVNFKTMFVVFLSDYFKYRRPILNIYFETYDFPAGSTASEIEQSYQEFYNQCVQKQKEWAL